MRQVPVELDYESINYTYTITYVWNTIRINCHSTNRSSIDYMKDYLPDYDTMVSFFPIEHTVDIYEMSLPPEICCSIREGLQTDFIRRKTFIDVCWREHAIVFNHTPAKLFICEKNWNVILISVEDTIILIYTDTTRSPEKHLLRTVREALYRKLENIGGVAIHAAAVAIGGNGYIICGPSGSGKTTFLSTLLQYGGADFITNDRVVLLTETDQVKIFHLPLSIRFGLGFALSNDVLKDYVLDKQTSRVQDYHADDIRNASVDIKKAWGSTKKLELTPRELCEKYQVQPCYHVDLKGIFFPVLHQTHAAKLLFTPIDRPRAWESLHREICTPQDPTWPEPWIIPHTKNIHTLQKQAVAFIEQTLAKTFCCRVEFSIGAHHRIDTLLSNALRAVNADVPLPEAIGGQPGNRLISK